MRTSLGGVLESLQNAVAPADADELAALVKRLGRYAHIPGVLKGLSKVDFSESLCATALEVVHAALAEQKEIGDVPITVSRQPWAVLTLAARADAAVLDEAEPAFEGTYVADRMRELRRFTAQAKERAAAGPPPEPGPPSPEDDVPASVGKVKKWLAAADRDPAILAPRPKQKAAQRAAAIRALASMGTPEAFAVLKQYAEADPPTAVRDEIMRSWASFDRADYAAAMFRPNRGAVDLGVVDELSGIEAIGGMTTLRVVLPDGPVPDLTPLGECRELTSLDLTYRGGHPPTEFEWLRALPGLRELSLSGGLGTADLAPLTASAVVALTLWLNGADGAFLLDMPALERVTIIAATFGEPDAAPPHPGLTDVALALLERGVKVTVYDFDKRWVAEFAPRAAEAGFAEKSWRRGTRTFSRTA